MVFSGGWVRGVKLMMLQVEKFTFGVACRQADNKGHDLSLESEDFRATCENKKRVEKQETEFIKQTFRSF